MSNVKITTLADCGNSPKGTFLRDFNIAFAKGNADFIIESVTDDILWVMHGDKTVEGIEAFTKEINMMKEYKADELKLNSIITHGREGAVNGEIKMGGKVYVFCDIYTFKSSSGNAIKSMQSYVIEVNS